MISEIAFEQIQGNFWYGAYGEFRVIMMKDSGYINATKMCSSGGKDYNLWARNNAGKVLVDAVSKKLTEVQACENMQATFDDSDLTLPFTDHTIIRSVISPSKKVNTDNKTEIDSIISGT